MRYGTDTRLVRQAVATVNKRAPGRSSHRLFVGSRWLFLLMVVLLGLGGCGDGGGLAGDLMVDCDGDGIPDIRGDLLSDVNGDGEVNEDDCGTDDGLESFLDCDGDGVRDTSREQLEDADGDGIINIADCPAGENLVDCDGDGILEPLPLEDSDGNGVIDEEDCPSDQGLGCDIGGIRGSIQRALEESNDGAIADALELDCLIDSACGGLPLVGDADEDGMSNAFELLFADVSGGPLNPCKADTDGDGIADALDLVRGSDAGIQLNMAVRRYIQITDFFGEMDDPGDGDPYFWGGSWLASGAGERVNLRFNRFTFDNHIEDVDEWNEHEGEEWNGPEFLEEPIRLSADVTEWVTTELPEPFLHGSLVILDHDGAGGGRGETGSCDAELYLPGEPEIDSCDTNGEPDPTGLMTPGYGDLLLDLVDLLTGIQTGDVTAGALPTGGSIEDIGGNEGLVLPLYNLPDPRLRLDVWVGVEHTSGSPIDPCTVTTAVQASELLQTGGILIPEDWDPSCGL